MAIAAATQAQGAELRLLVDSDANPATGCTVATANGAFAGVERRFIATVDTAQDPPRVTGVTQENCTSAPATFGAPTPVSAGGWPVGLGNGTGGANVIEVGVPAGGSGRTYLGVEYFDAAIGVDAATSGAGGGPIVVLSHAPGHAESVPTLGDAMILLLVLLLAGTAWRFGRKHLHAAPLAVVALALVTTLAWAAIVVDGLTSDWAGIPPVASDPADAPNGADITAVFATIESPTLFVRVDARTGRPPVAVADNYVAVAGATTSIGAGAGLLANDTAGVPAGTVAAFGGGSLGGTVTANPAGATASFGVGGSLIVNADGSFDFTPATGFTGNFTFSYRVANANGSSDAMVTLATQQAPAITSGNAATFNVGTAGTFTVTATGFPAPTLSLAGGLPTGLAFDPSTGVLSGTPAPGTAGAYPLTFTAANGVAPDAIQPFTLTVTQGVAITSAATTTFTVGAPGTFTVTTTGSPVAGTITITGALPANVTFTNNGNGTATLAGTPAAATGGEYPITITADNGAGPPGVQPFTLVVQQAPAFTSAAATTFTVGAAGTFTPAATGFPPPTFTLTGALPAGVAFDAGTGTLSGTPLPGTQGTYPLTFTATNFTTATQPFTLAVDDPAGAVDDAYSFAHDTVLVVPPPGILANDVGTPAPTLAGVTGTGAACTVFPCVITTANGNATVAANGGFAYTPAPSFAGTDSFTYEITNGVGTDVATVTITVTNERPVVDLDGPGGGIDFAATFTEGSPAVAIVDAAQLVVSDADDTQLTGATITITNLLDGAAETLGVACPDAFPGCSGGIVDADVTYTAATGTLEILATAPLADYQALLRTLVYHNASASPDDTPRDITITVSDGIDDNLPLAHAIVSIAGVNQAPVITAPAAVSTPVDTAHVFAGTVSVSDPDSGTGDLQVVLTATNGIASLSGTAGLVVSGNGTATVTATGPLASLNAALNGASFTPAASYSGAASLAIDVDDLGNTGTGGALTDNHVVAITVNNLPAVTSTVPAAGASSVSTTGTLTVTFSEMVLFTAASFTLECPVGSAVPFSLSAPPSASVVITPTVSLPAGAACRLTVNAAEIANGFGQNPAADTVVDFSTNSLPTVISTSPANGATAVQPTTAITVGFSESVNANAGAFSLECPVGTPIGFTASATPAASVTLTPSTSLPPGTLCSANVIASQVTDADAGQAMAANHAFSFTTGTPPSFTSGNAVSATVGSALNFPVTTSGTPTITSLVAASVTPGPGGTLPSGLAFSYASGASGAIAGTPDNAAHVGTYVLSFAASNGIAPDASQNPFTLTLACPAITLAPANGSTFTATYNQAFSQAFAPTGGTAPYTYVVGGSALPAVGFSGNDLAGTPSNTGSFGFTVQAVDTYGCTSAVQAYTLNVDPSAADDAYGALGNVLVNSNSGPGTPFSVLANDSFPGATGSITGFAATSVQGGAVNVAVDGTFTYNPPRGYTGADSFTYTLASNGRSATGTVAFTVSGMVWFVDNAPGACVADCDGRRTNPFTDIAALQAVNTGAARQPAANHPIFVYGTGTNYTGNLVLLSGQRLVGQGATGSLATLGAITTQPGQVLPATGATPPRLGGTVTVATGNFIHGLTLAGNGALSGTAFGTLTISDNVRIDTTGQGIGLADGNLVGGLVELTSTGGVFNASLANVTTGGGPFSLGTGELAGATTNEALRIDGGNGSFAYAGTISNSVAGAVRIQNKTGGTVTLSGSINPLAAARGILVSDNSTGANTITFSGPAKRISAGINPGVALLNNTGATIEFTNGGLEIATTSGAGFRAVGGGTVLATGAGNRIASTTGTALTVTNTTIGAGGLVFRSISSNGAANGILLDTTGNTAGLTVTGDGGGAANGSGGTIAGSTGIGVRLTSTRDSNLGYLNVQGSQDAGIKGINLTNFTLNRCNVTGNGNSTLDEGIQLGEFAGATVGVTGVVSITNCDVSGNAHNNFHIRNTSGSITSFTVTGSSFDNLNDTFGANAFLYEGSGTSSLVAGTISGNRFRNNSPQRALEVQAHDAATVGGLVVSGNEFENNGIHASFTQDTTANLDFDFVGNGTALSPMVTTDLHAVNVFSSATSTGGSIIARIGNNYIGSGATTMVGNAIRAFIQGRTAATLLIDNNTIRHVGTPTNGGRGIDLQFVGPTALGQPTTVSHVSILNNDVDTMAPASAFGLAAIYLAADDQGSPATVRANIAGNLARNSIGGGSWDWPSFDGSSAHLIFDLVMPSATAQLLGAGPAQSQLVSGNPATAAAQVYAAPGVTTFAGPVTTP